MPFHIKLDIKIDFGFKWLGFRLKSRVLKIYKDSSKKYPYPKVEAIKYLRKQAPHLGLMDAKHQVEKWLGEKHGTNTTTSRS